MNITDINIFTTKKNGRVKAYVSIILDHVFIVRDLKVIQRNGDLSVVMPRKKTKDGKYQDIAHPLTQDIRDFVEQKIIEKYMARISAASKSYQSLT